MIVALVAAAGTSARFGGAKLLAPLGGEPLVRATVRALCASEVDAVVVVTGPGGADVARALAGLPVRVVEHPGAGAGLGSTLAAGVESLGSDAAAVLVALGDQPTVPAAAVAALVARWRAGAARRAAGGAEAAIVVPVYRRERGHPVLFDASVFGELRALHGDAGARAVVARDAARVSFVPLDLPLPPDVDTPAELAALERRVARGDVPAPG